MELCFLLYILLFLLLAFKSVIHLEMNDRVAILKRKLASFYPSKIMYLS